MESLPKVTIRLDDKGDLVDVDVDGHAPGELVEERDREPPPSFSDYPIRRNWVAGG